MFQFQYGAIKRFRKLDFFAFCTSFNSNMVRLKGFSSLSKINLLESFNSNMVRLKVAYKGC